MQSVNMLVFKMLIFCSAGLLGILCCLIMYNFVVMLTVSGGPNVGSFGSNQYSC
jgi:hypothetical protein